MMDSDMASAIANGESAEQTDGSTTDTIGELFPVKKNELSKNAERITDWYTDLDQKVVRSRTLTEKGKQERIQTLKNKQKTALGNVTKKRNDISRNMCSESNLHLVKSALDDYNDLFMEYQECTQAYCELIDDEQTLADESDRFDNKEMSITSYRSQVESWIYTAERRLADDLENTSRRTSHCSGASRSSRASGRSQVSERTIAKARLAELLAQKDLSQQQAALELQRSALQLDIKIAKVRAREKVFAEAELDSSVVKVEPSEHVVMSGNHGNHKSDVDKKVPLHVNLNDQIESVTNVNQTVNVHDHDTGRIVYPINDDTHIVNTDVQNVTCNVPQSVPLVGVHQLNAQAPMFQPVSQVSNPDPVNSVQQQIRDIATYISLPALEVPKYNGDPTEFNSFMLAFDTRIAQRAASDSDRLYYLQQHLTGEPRELIEGCMYLSPSRGYQEACQLLSHEYGDPHKVSTSYLNTILRWKPLHPDDCTSLRKFSFFLVKCNNAMQNVANLGVLNHIPNLQIIISKLPSYLQNKWRDQVSKMKNREQRVPQYADVVSFVRSAAESANDPAFSKEALSKADPKPAKTQNGSQHKGKSKMSSFAVDLQDTTKPNKPSNNAKQSDGKRRCSYCEKPHDIESCHEFLKLTVDERREFLKEKRLCFGCLGFNHTAKGCMKRRTCQTCSKRHPTCLHIDGFKFTPAAVKEEQAEPVLVDSTENKVNNKPVSSLATGSGEYTVLQAVVPVNVRQKGQTTSKCTYAFYDPGSTGCFMSEELKDELNIEGQSNTLQLKTMHGVSYISTTAINGLIVSDLQLQNEVELPKTYTRPEIPVTPDQIPKPEMLEKWPHLQEVSRQISGYNPEWNVGLLIGSNCPAALEPIRVISMKDSSPIAIQYRHGWTINGPLKVELGDQNDILACNRVALQEIESVKEVLSPTQVLSILESDFTQCQASVPGERGPSREDTIFLERAAKDIKTVDGHYMLPLPFRNVDVLLPNNKGQAIKRAMYQKRKMLQDPAYRRDYVQFVDNILQKGYAAKVPDDELLASPGHVWYLPHHGVYNPRKPEKIRVVFDCSCKYNGISLNDCLIPGPDLTNSLVGVLTRFREHKIAFIGDIESMFYQVLVPEDQYSYLRFMWWENGDLNADLQEYHMKVHLFGAVSSPSISNFALRQIATDQEDEIDQETGHTITRHFYVDDCLRSMPTPETASNALQEVTSACSKGGFRLTKFSSNNKEVLQSIPKEERSKECKSKELDYDQLLMARTLGIQWSLESDKFGFTIVLGEKPMTRRGLLVLVCTVFDPLGFVAPFILTAKRILQDLCREKMEWDEEISEPYRTKFATWIQDVPLLQDIELERCFRPPDFGEVKSCQLHVFADASSYGYGAVAYLRLTDSEKIHVSFVIGKARLAPLKATTIPRLELTAATVAVQIGQTVKRELDMKIDSLTYYTDSTTVLHYLRSKTKRFPIFVANRVQQILDFCTPEQWKYVETSINSADIASRGVEGSKIQDINHWLEGPKFLHQQESEWPEQPDLSNNAKDSDSEIEVLTTNLKEVNNESTATETLLSYFSDWHKLKKTVAVFNMLKSILHQRIMKKKGNVMENTDSYFPFTVELLEQAECSILKHVQEQHFKGLIDQLSQSFDKTSRHRGRVKKQDPIHRLDPVMDNANGLLRVGGRLSKAAIPGNMKHPILLPAKGHITSMIIRHAHEQLAHSGRNHVSAKLRERYWIISMNSAVRRVLFKCVRCRRQKKPCADQKMADLPEDRIEQAPPFTHTGIDLFGPFLIKERRKELKRYGVVFTCLASRAIHLEAVNSLETDSFMNALQRFIARRGPIKEIRCDNGSNFVGASRELQEAIKELNQDQVQQRLLHQDIAWKFNPPAASHMGGVWERQIRSVRNVLSSLVQDHGTRLDDECFHTFLCEVENIINSRPLTSISNDVDDYQPLTPNQILTLKPTTLPPPGNFEQEDLYLKKRWRRVQYLSRLFWTRWTREYLVTLQQRQKWLYPQWNFQSGDIVILKDDTAPRYRWPMARVMEVEADKTGTVRSLKLKTSTTELCRPIHKLVLLLPKEDQ